MIGLMCEEEQGGFCKEESDKLGYDWSVVCFFAKIEPELLKYMWGSDNPYYRAILQNQLSPDMTRIILAAQTVFEPRLGAVAISTLLIRAFQEPDQAISS